jgi:Cu-processing system ATP-binding protein
MSEQLLDIQRVTKRFGAVHALDGVSLQLAAGERLALLGHNGAGKTTLFRTILGFIAPDEGTLSIAGHTPGSLAARKTIAFLPESVAFAKTLTGREILRLFARLKGEPVSAADSALERVGLADAAGRRSGTYSKGMRQRLGLAQALLGKPRLLVLDEPTSGLDPLSRNDLYAILGEISHLGAAILLSSHSLSEVEAETDRVTIMRSGRIVADATLRSLQQDAGLPIRIRVKAREETIGEVSGTLGGTRLNGASLELLCPASDKMARLAAISRLGEKVTDVDISTPSLDDVYRHFSTRDGKEDRQ